MKRYLSTAKRALTNLLLVGLFVSSSTAVGAGNMAAKSEGEAGPTSVRSATTLLRNYALTTVPGQRTAGDISKQNGVKRPITIGGLAPGESGIATARRQFLVTTDRSVLYLSFRSSRPGGRAPPASA